MSPETLHEQTGRALLAAVDRRLIGFAEIPLAAQLASHVRSGRGLTTPQARQAWRILKRIEDKLHTHGITVPGIAAPAPVAQQAAPRVTELAMRADGRIGVSHAPYELNPVFHDALHSTWDRRREQWPFPATPAYAGALVEALEAGNHAYVASERVLALAAEYREQAAARAALDPASPLPGYDYSRLIVPGASVWDHQRRGIEFVAGQSATLLAMPMGSGKTATTVWALNRLRTGRAVIVCPNKVRGVWPREIKKWSSLPWHIVDGKRPARRAGARSQDLTVPERLHEAEACLFDCPCGAIVHCAIMNYEMLSHDLVARWVPPQPLDALVYDEIHRLKSPTGVVSKTAHRWVPFARRRVGLTGTPMPQHPWDIFGVLRALDPGILGPVWTPFKSLYVATKIRQEDGKEYPVAIHPERRREFVERLHRIMYRPTVDLKLPGATHSIREVELEPAARREYTHLDKALQADLSPFTVTFVPEGEEAEEFLHAKNLVSKMMRLSQLTGGTLPGDEQPGPDGKLFRALHRVSRAKTDMLAEFAPRPDRNGVYAITGGILDEIGCTRPGGEPVVVYCQFRPDLDAVREVAEKAGLRYAEISGRRSDGLSETSEMNPDCDILGVQIQSGGTGVDLTRSRYGIWYSVGHSLGDYDQALKRQDRPGQTRPVLFIHLVATGTVDENVYAGLAARRSIVGSMLKARGVDPRHAGLSEDDGAVLSAAEIEELFNSRAAGGETRTLSTGVPLPVDEFAADVMGDPRGYGPRTRAEVPDAATLAEFGMEGLFD